MDISTDSVAYIITQGRHGGRTWKAPNGFGFAAAEHRVELADAEIVAFAEHLPFAFYFSENGWQALGIIGHELSGNVCVTPEGQWRSGYVPAALRGYPFAITEGNEAKLTIDESSGLLLDTYDGNPFFDTSGNLSPLLLKTRAFLIKLREGRRKLSLAIRELDKCGLLVPWEKLHAHLNSPNGEPDLCCIDETRFKALSDSEFLRLRWSNAISLIYAQLYSQRKLPTLIRLTEAHRHPVGKATAVVERGNNQPGNELLTLMTEEMANLGREA
ncbi:SapC family protein [uncultured Marinobacter sp.]|uniref:SapC family protein n=1 Tax=uncultured Marinobacter sp. TaxID=187379 RepID=UPI00258E8F0B|nr:SapC family protein [uncultured Marinobacter sp.]